MNPFLLLMHVLGSIMIYLLSLVMFWTKVLEILNLILTL